jgi:NhaD family Na+/H+ antiporter
MWDTFTSNSSHALMLALFVIGYLAIIFEHRLRVNKTASALLMAVATWTVLFGVKVYNNEAAREIMNEHVGTASQIIFFLIGAMTIVELIDSHNGFKIITNAIRTRSKRKMLWLIGFLAFFLSAILDNLTTTIVLISLLKKLIPERKERIFYGSAVVIAANAGGAWTPIGDVTTTMLWIKGNLTTLSVMKNLFLPSLFSMVVTFILLGLHLKGKFHSKHEVTKEVKYEPGAKLVFFTGVLALVFVPFFRALTDLPPFMGMLLGVGILWLITDIMHFRFEDRKHLRIPHILTRIDISGVLFFLGILLVINSLEIIGVLKTVALWLDVHISNLSIISMIIGLLSAVIDNVPLVAASIGMYDLAVYPTDSALWNMIAYCAGTGGSIFIIGSAAGVAFMGIEKVDFIWYMKKVSLTALAGFLAGMALYLLLSLIPI